MIIFVGSHGYFLLSIFMSAELELSGGREHLEHLAAPALKLGPLRVGAMSQITASLGMSNQGFTRVLGDVMTADHVNAAFHESLGGETRAPSREAVDQGSHARKVGLAQI